MTQAENKNKAPALKLKGVEGFVDILVFIIPCLQFVQFKLVGRLSASDVLILLVFIVFAVRLRLRITTPVGKWLMTLGSLWLVSQCVTDVVRRSAFHDYARGWSGIGVILACLAVLWTLLYDQPRRILIYGWGLVLGNFLSFLIFPDEGMTVAPWKFGVARPLSLAVFLLVSRKEFRGISPIIVGSAMGILNIVMGSRAVGGMCLAASLYLLVMRTMRRQEKKARKFQVKSVIAVTALILLGVSGLMWTYQYAASTGALGDDARRRFERQSSGQYGILLGGRMDVLGAFFAIYDSPILGHGSWAKDPKYLILQEQTLTLLDYNVEGDISPEALEEGLIPSHSHILNAWVDGGILGAFFWVWVLFMIVKRMAQVHPSSVELLPLASFAAFTLLWDLLFSPYGAEMRIITPYFIVTVLSCMVVNSPVVDQTVSARVRKSVESTSKLKSLGESASA